MAAPDDQIGRFWMGHPQEAFGTVVQVFGVGVGIREAGALIDRVHEMGAITSRMSRFLRMQGNINDGRTVAPAERSSSWMTQLLRLHPRGLSQVLTRFLCI